MIRQYELLEKIKSYLPQFDEALLNKAYVFALQAHGEQKRASGEPYFSHPLEVANILADLHLDLDTIMTGLLHDTVEDTHASLEDIEKNFGSSVAKLVDGVTKLSQIEWQSNNTKQAENFRKLVLAMASDMRVLLVKLADRLHNMRTLAHIPSEEKRKRISQETVDIYAPLAERIGIHHIKEELEELAFAQLHADAHTSIKARLHFLREQGEDTIRRIHDELMRLMNEQKIDCEILGREKTPYSIWRKMRQRKVPFEQITDIMAFRVLVQNQQDCYRALGAIHSHYPVIPERFKDYISTPKPNNYKSIHTTVFGPNKHRIEIQIRTRRMHEIAEHGVAAHWKYKQNSDTDTQEYRWLRGLLDILEHSSDPEEFLEHTKLEMFQDQVFCFTPAGDLISLPQGATVIDFAYAIHSDVGNRCVSAKIDGHLAPLRTILKNGSQIEICTSNSQTPSPTWEKFVVTGKARANIRRFIRNQQRQQYIILGKSILQKAFKKENVKFHEKECSVCFSHYKAKSLDDIYVMVGSGAIHAHEVVRKIHPEIEGESKPTHELPIISKRSADLHHHAVPLKGLVPGMAIHYAGCCHPLPGDRIVGIVITGKGVTIHTRDCETLRQYDDEPERWLDVSWEDAESITDKHSGRIYVMLVNESGSLANLSTVISQQEANIINLKITNRTENFFDMIVDLEVKSSDHLSNIIGSLRSAKNIVSVERV